jgi:hypothetical protein
VVAQPFRFDSALGTMHSGLGARVAQETAMWKLACWLVGSATLGLCALTATAATPRVVLIGASIGQAWELPDLPKRTGDHRFQFEALQAWQFDKSELVQETLMRPERKFKPTLGYVKGFFAPPQPADIIILKECSSYFPGSQADYRQMLQAWVTQIRAARKQLILATTVPVTQARAGKDPGKQRALREFNDWLRAFAQQEGIVLLDLEAALRTDDQERFLRDEYTSGDGSHLNSKAYAVLDRSLLATLAKLAPR